MRHEKVLELASRPMVEWDKILSRWIDGGPGFEFLPPLSGRPDLAESICHLEAVIVHLARFQAYANERHGYGCGDQGHNAAIKAQNVLATKIRKALGYTYPKQEVTV